MLSTFLYCFNNGYWLIDLYVSNVGTGDNVSINKLAFVRTLVDNLRVVLEKQPHCF